MRRASDCYTGGRVPECPAGGGLGGLPQVILKFCMPGGEFWCIFRTKIYIYIFKVVVNFIITKEPLQFHEFLKKIHL